MRIRLLTPVALAVAGVFLTPAITGLGGAAHAAQNQELRISSMAADISTLDPHRATSTSDKAVVGQIFNGLVRFPPGSRSEERRVGKEGRSQGWRDCAKKSCE